MTSDVGRTYVRNERSFASAEPRPRAADVGRGGAASGSCEGAAAAPRVGAAIWSCAGAASVRLKGAAAGNLTKNFKFSGAAREKI